MRITSLTALIIGISLSASAADLKLTKGNYQIDNAHTKVSFMVKHFMISDVEGRFNEVSGTFSVGDKVTDTKVDVTIPVRSINTDVKKRDDHLKSPDFFDAQKYPNITFKSKKFSGSFDNFKVTGDLTIKNVTKEVTLNGKFTGTIKEPSGAVRAAVLAEGEINRKEFNILYNDLVESTPVVGDEVTIKIVSEGILQK